MRSGIIVLCLCRFHCSHWKQKKNAQSDFGIQRGYRNNIITIFCTSSLIPSLATVLCKYNKKVIIFVIFLAIDTSADSCHRGASSSQLQRDARVHLSNLNIAKRTFCVPRGFDSIIACTMKRRCDVKAFFAITVGTFVSLFYMALDLRTSRQGASVLLLHACARIASAMVAVGRLRTYAYSWNCPVFLLYIRLLASLRSL